MSKDAQKPYLDAAEKAKKDAKACVTVSFGGSTFLTQLVQDLRQALLGAGDGNNEVLEEGPNQEDNVDGAPEDMHMDGFWMRPLEIIGSGGYGRVYAP